MMIKGVINIQFKSRDIILGMKIRAPAISETIDAIRTRSSGIVLHQSYFCVPTGFSHIGKGFDRAIQQFGDKHHSDNYSKNAPFRQADPKIRPAVKAITAAAVCILELCSFFKREARPLNAYLKLFFLAFTLNLSGVILKLFFDGFFSNIPWKSLIPLSGQIYHLFCHAPVDNDVLPVNKVIFGKEDAGLSYI